MSQGIKLLFLFYRSGTQDSTRAPHTHVNLHHSVTEYSLSSYWLDLQVAASKGREGTQMHVHGPSFSFPYLSTLGVGVPIGEG